MTKTIIDEIIQNSEKGPGDLRKLDITQSPVKDHLLTLAWKTCKDLKNNF